MRLHDLYARYRDRVQFLVIHIREAHPVDEWWLGGGVPGLMLKLSKTKAAMDVTAPACDTLGDEGWELGEANVPLLPQCVRAERARLLQGGVP